MTQSNDDNENIQILIGYGSYGCGTHLELTPESTIIGTVHPDDTEVLIAILRDAADAIESAAKDTQNIGVRKYV